MFVSLRGAIWSVHRLPRVEAGQPDTLLDCTSLHSPAALQVPYWRDGSLDHCLVGAGGRQIPRGRRLALAFGGFPSHSLPLTPNKCNCSEQDMGETAPHLGYFSRKCK